MITAHKKIVNEVSSIADEQERERIWSTVTKERTLLEEQCYSSDWPDVNDLYKYWGVDEKKEVNDKRHHAFRNKESSKNPIKTQKTSKFT